MAATSGRVAYFAHCRLPPGAYAGVAASVRADGRHVPQPDPRHWRVDIKMYSTQWAVFVWICNAVRCIRASSCVVLCLLM